MAMARLCSTEGRRRSMPGRADPASAKAPAVRGQDRLAARFGLAPEPRQGEREPLEAVRLEGGVPFEGLDDAVGPLAEDQALQGAGLGIEQPVLGDADGGIVVELPDAVLRAAGRGDD